MAGFFSRLKSIFSGHSAIDEDFYEELEETLIMGDMGITATEEVMEELRRQVKERHVKETEDCRELLKESIKEQMQVPEDAYDFENQQSVIMVIGVNGVGKTTSVGKLAAIYKKQGKRVLIAAADTFRAAAGEQLDEWAKRAGVEIISGAQGADPSSVIFDAVSAAKARNVDILLCDTAGRLHNKKNLMEELKKMNRIIDREFPDVHRENLVVLDGTTGQNALVQAREFGETADLTGIILTKMDGTAKGGIAVAIHAELDIPVKYIGVGEKLEDLRKFDVQEYVDGLLEMKGEEDGYENADT
jgi:signal recognition particle-docking protein ftsY